MAENKTAKKAEYDLIGIGIGPFNLSLASLLDKTKQVKSIFFDQKNHFQWHTELMFSDADMQTSFLKDLVTPVDPTSPYSFLNYLVSKGLFYSFMNTNRKVVSRREFEMYCQWVSEQLGPVLNFESPVEEINFDGDKFIVRTNRKTFTSENICLGTGITARVPLCAEGHLGANMFHAKSGRFDELDLKGKKVVIIGGGQTGVEVFRNAIRSKWGRAQSVRLVTSRQNLEPLDESPFTNEYFTPNYVREFFRIDENLKASIVQHQKLASDGNTPDYLCQIYNDLYQLKHVEQDPRDIRILPFRRMTKVERAGNGFTLEINNGFLQKKELLQADVVILCTGFHNAIPQVIKPIQHLISFDELGRFHFNKTFSIHWQGPAKNKIYALNFSRHSHGISEPQTSLMSWRSATIVNDLVGEKVYLKTPPAANFTSYHEDFLTESTIEI